MSRRRLLAVAFAVLYIGAIVWLTFLPQSGSDGISGLWSFIALLPVGALLMVLLGPRRWWLALGFGALGAAWIEAAQSVWMPAGYASALDVLWGTMGAAVGVALGSVALTLSHRSMRSHTFPRIMSQNIRRESPED
jgi:glycopeptide antibiotics resistance protein